MVEGHQISQEHKPHGMGIFMARIIKGQFIGLPLQVSSMDICLPTCSLKHQIGLQCVQTGQSKLTLPPSSALLEMLLPQGRHSQAKPHFVPSYVWRLIKTISSSLWLDLKVCARCCGFRILVEIFKGENSFLGFLNCSYYEVFSLI